MGNGVAPENLDGHRETENERRTVDIDLIQVNKRFNQDLVLLSQNELSKNHFLKLVKPSEKLIDAGVSNFEIELSASRLLRKSMQEEHKFELLELRNLPILIQNPVAVFSSATQLGAFVVMLEIEKKGEPFVVALHVKTFSNTQINSIRSVHYRKAKHLIYWIHKKHLLWVDKEKALNWISKLRRTAEVAYLVKGATSIIKNFGFVPKNNKKNDEYNFLGLINFSRKSAMRTYKLNGELGKFLGEYDRNRYSIVIRGDKGAGKSRLLYQLINAFASKLYRVAFLSFEMGIHSAITLRQIQVLSL